MKISINAPSYKRANNVDTLNYLPSCKIWVDCKEYDEYKKNYEKFNIVSCPEGVQGNLCRVRNYILDQEFKNGVDVCVLVDDDLRYIGYYEKLEFHKLESEFEVYRFIEKYTIIAQELGVKFWGVNIKLDKQNYREYTPFSFKSYIGGPFQAHLPNSIRYDERLPLKEDYDLTLQHLNINRKVLRVNKYFYAVKQAENIGGCAAYRNIQREKDQLELLQKKWGKEIVKQDTGISRSHNTTKKRSYDINPIIKVPIKGI